MYKLNDEKMFYDLAEGQAIVINSTTGIYYGTSSLGSAVLDALLSGVTVEAITAAVKTLPGCPDHIEEEIDSFVKKLVEKEIILSDNRAVAECTIAQSALADGFALTVDEFSEVQDLILADPVHDVDVEQGWPILNQ